MPRRSLHGSPPRFQPVTTTIVRRLSKFRVRRNLSQPAPRAFLDWPHPGLTPYAPRLLRLFIRFSRRPKVILRNPAPEGSETTRPDGRLGTMNKLRWTEA